MSNNCTRTEPIVGCLKKEDGSLEAITIHYEYGVDVNGDTILVSTIYTNSVGEPITLGENESVSTGSCNPVNAINPQCGEIRISCVGYDNGFTPGSSSNDCGARANFIRFSWPFTVDGYTYNGVSGQGAGSPNGGYAQWTPQLQGWSNFFNAQFLANGDQDKYNAAFGFLPKPTWRYSKITTIDPNAVFGTLEMTRDDTGCKYTVYPVLEKEEIKKVWYYFTLDCDSEGNTTKNIHFCEPDPDNLGSFIAAEYPTWQPEEGGAEVPVPFECIAPCFTDYDSLIDPDAVSPCVSTIYDQLCDRLEDDSTVEYVIILHDCGGSRSLETYTLDSWLTAETPDELVEYEPVGEPCEDCEETGRSILCDPDTCEKYELIRYSNCAEELVLFGTDIEASPKGNPIECVDKNIISEKCYESQLFFYEWDNGYAGYRPNIEVRPGTYNTPHGSVLLINGTLPTTYQGFIDRNLTCGTATIDQINIDGVDLLTSPVVETTTTGTWVALNNLVWDTITANSAYSLPAGRGCDVPPVTPSTNCFGRSISCDDIPADENGDIGYFDVTDCKDRTWRFSIRKTAQPASKYTGLQYFDCKGELVCEYFDADKQPVILDEECLTEVCCTVCDGGLDQAILDKLCEIAELLTVEECEEECISKPLCVRGFDYQDLDTWEKGSMEWTTPAGTSVDQPAAQDNGGKCSWYTNLMANVSSNAGWSMTCKTDVPSDNSGEDKPVFQITGPCDSSIEIVRNGNDTLTIKTDAEGNITGAFTEGGNSIESETFVSCEDK